MFLSAAATVSDVELVYIHKYRYNSKLEIDEVVVKDGAGASVSIVESWSGLATSGKPLTDAYDGDDGTAAQSDETGVNFFAFRLQSVVTVSSVVIYRKNVGLLVSLCGSDGAVLQSFVSILDVSPTTFTAGPVSPLVKHFVLFDMQATKLKIRELQLFNDGGTNVAPTCSHSGDVEFKGGDAGKAVNGDLTDHGESSKAGSTAWICTLPAEHTVESVKVYTEDQTTHGAWLLLLDDDHRVWRHLVLSATAVPGTPVTYSLADGAACGGARYPPCTYQRLTLNAGREGTLSAAEINVVDSSGAVLGGGASSTFSWPTPPGAHPPTLLWDGDTSTYLRQDVVTDAVCFSTWLLTNEVSASSGANLQVTRRAGEPTQCHGSFVFLFAGASHSVQRSWILRCPSDATVDLGINTYAPTRTLTPSRSGSSSSTHAVLVAVVFAPSFIDHNAGFVSITVASPDCDGADDLPELHVAAASHGVFDVVRNMVSGPFLDLNRCGHHVDHFVRGPVAVVDGLVVAIKLDRWHRHAECPRDADPVTLAYQVHAGYGNTACDADDRRNATADKHPQPNGHCDAGVDSVVAPRSDAVRLYVTDAVAKQIADTAIDGLQDLGLDENVTAVRDPDATAHRIVGTDTDRLLPTNAATIRDNSNVADADAKSDWHIGGHS